MVGKSLSQTSASDKLDQLKTKEFICGITKVQERAKLTYRIDQIATASQSWDLMMQNRVLTKYLDSIRTVLR